MKQRGRSEVYKARSSELGGRVCVLQSAGGQRGDKGDRGGQPRWVTNVVDVDK